MKVSMHSLKVRIEPFSSSLQQYLSYVRSPHKGWLQVELVVRASRGLAKFCVLFWLRRSKILFLMAMMSPADDSKTLHVIGRILYWVERKAGLWPNGWSRPANLKMTVLRGFQYTPHSSARWVLKGIWSIWRGRSGDKSSCKFWKISWWWFLLFEFFGMSNKIRHTTVSFQLLCMRAPRVGWV